MAATPRSDILKSYDQLGFEEVSTDSGTGSRILVNDQLRRVIKLNEQQAYHAFAEYAKNQDCEHLPQIFSHAVHQCTDVFNGDWFTVTEMEKLSPLSEEEAHAVLTWYRGVMAKNTPQTALDTLDLTPTFQELKALAIASGHNLDMGKSSNYMVREIGAKRIIVVTDPFD